MLVSTGLLPHVRACIDCIGKWKWSPVNFPYKLETQVISGETDTSDKIMFAANPGYQWISHVVILISGILLFVYQASYEDDNILAVITHFTQVAIFAASVVFAYAQHGISKPLEAFFSDIINSESRWIN